MATRTTKTSSKSKDADAALAELSSQVDNLRKDLSGMMDAMSDFGLAQGHQVAGRAADAAGEVSEQAQELGRVQLKRLDKKTRQLRARTEDFVVSQPQVALGVAVGLGFFLGLWTAKK